jgi:hypothetical protein
MLMKNEGMSVEQWLKLGDSLKKAIPHEMLANIAQEWIDNPVKLEEAIYKALMPSQQAKKVLCDIGGVANGKHLSPIEEWQLFYQKYFEMSLDFSDVHIPEKPEGEWRLLIIPNLSLKNIRGKFSEYFEFCWVCSDENTVSFNERDAKNGAYAIWVEDMIEVNEDRKNFSNKEIKGKKIATETLAERLIHGFKFFDETGKHLDMKKYSRTLCAGSRYSNGCIPTVISRKHYDKPSYFVNVGYAREGSAAKGLSYRRVVS